MGHCDLKVQQRGRESQMGSQREGRFTDEVLVSYKKPTGNSTCPTPVKTANLLQRLIETGSGAMSEMDSRNKGSRVGN